MCTFFMGQNKQKYMYIASLNSRFPESATTKWPLSLKSKESRSISILLFIVLLSLDF